MEVGWPAVVELHSRSQTMQGQQVPCSEEQDDTLTRGHASMAAHNKLSVALSRAGSYGCMLCMLTAAITTVIRAIVPCPARNTLPCSRMTACATVQPVNERAVKEKTILQLVGTVMVRRRTQL